jgi:hypothetical protein
LERARVGAAEFKRRRNPTSKDGRSRVATGGPGLAEADLERLSPHAPTCFRGTGDPSHARVQVTLRAGAGGPPPASLRARGVLAASEHGTRRVGRTPRDL